MKKFTTTWTKKHADLARSSFASGVVSQERICSYGWTKDDSARCVVLLLKESGVASSSLCFTLGFLTILKSGEDYRTCIKERSRMMVRGEGSWASCAACGDRWFSWTRMVATFRGMECMARHSSAYVRAAPYHSPHFEGTRGTFDSGKEPESAGKWCRRRAERCGNEMVLSLLKELRGMHGKPETGCMLRLCMQRAFLGRLRKTRIVKKAEGSCYTCCDGRQHHSEVASISVNN